MDVWRVVRAARDVPGVRAPGACRVRGSAHRLRCDAPLSGLDLACFLRMLARGIAGRVEPARARRRFGPDGLRASVSPTPSCSSPDRGAEMIGVPGMGTSLGVQVPRKVGLRRSKWKARAAR